MTKGKQLDLSVNFYQTISISKAIASRLKQHGFKVQTEVKFNGGYADIVTDWMGETIIEVKRWLTRKTIFESSGQLHLYGLHNAHNFVITGFYPNDLEEQKSAITTASMVEQISRIKVLFIE